jgi:hypothetical protein
VSRMSCGRSLSRDLLTGKTTSTNPRIIENLTRNRLYFKKEPVPSGVAMSYLFYGIKKHTSKSRETIPLTSHKLMAEMGGGGAISDDISVWHAEKLVLGIYDPQ